MIRPLILITNDDGIASPGIRAAVRAVEELGDIIVSAPAVQQSGMGRSFPREKDTGVIDRTELLSDEGRIPAYGVHGSPAQAVAHAVMELTDRRPDLCISGVNYGENLGMTVTCSGTLGAAFEAVSLGIPAIAVSVAADLAIQRRDDLPESPDDGGWQTAETILRHMARRVLTQGFPAGTDILNINLPADASDPEDYRITTLSRQNYFSFLKPGKRDYARPFQLPSKILVNEETLESDSDIYTLYVEKKISVTPLNVQMSVKLTQ